VNRTKTLRALAALTGRPWSGRGQFYHADDYSMSVAPIDPLLRTDTLKWQAETGDDLVTRLGRTPGDAVRVLMGATSTVEG